MEGDYVNAAISIACGIPAVGTVIAAAAKGTKAVKAAAKIADVCKAVGKAGNVAAGVKANYDTYMQARSEGKSAGEALAYTAGAMAAGLAAGTAANWAAKKVTNFAKANLPKMASSAKESAGKFTNKVSDAFDSFKNKNSSGKTLVTHRGTNESIVIKLEKGYLQANYPIPNITILRLTEHSKKAVWVSEGPPNLFNRIFSGMIGKKGEASITFEVSSDLVKRPDGFIKRWFGKAQSVIEEDVPIPSDAIVKFRGEKIMIIAIVILSFVWCILMLLYIIWKRGDWYLFFFQ